MIGMSFEECEAKAQCLDLLSSQPRVPTFPSETATVTNSVLYDIQTRKQSQLFHQAGGLTVFSHLIRTSAVS